jgi:hypothetical protein
MDSKTIKLILWIFILALSGCIDKNINPWKPNETYNTYLYAKRILRVYDSTMIQFHYKDNTDSTLKVEWSTNIGQIIGNGKTVVFKAPGMKCQALIKVIAIYKNEVIQDSIRIKVFNQIIMLKVDDFQFQPANTITQSWNKFINYIQSRKIKASLGIIGNSLLTANEQLGNYLKGLSDSNTFEFWNHGYDHVLSQTDSKGNLYSEFWNTPYSQQKEHLLLTQWLAKTKIGITLTVFGAPGNSFDSNTQRAVEEIPEITTWYFGPDQSTKRVLKRFVDIEFPTSYPDYNQFVSKYDSTKDYLVLQIHPNSWDENRFIEFEKVIDFLIEKDVTFMNPTEYNDLLEVKTWEEN